MERNWSINQRRAAVARWPFMNVAHGQVAKCASSAISLSHYRRWAFLLKVEAGVL